MHIKKKFDHYYRQFVASLPLNDRDYFKQWWNRLCKDIDEEINEIISSKNKVIVQLEKSVKKLK